jgi:hypothetical protein
MGHHVRALVTSLPNARRAMLQHREIRAFALPQGLAIIPLTTKLLEAFETSEPPGVDYVDALDELIAQLSHDGVIAQIETDYFGGAGRQRATAWQGGRVIFGPVTSEVGPINEALKRLGVRVVASDEFDSIELGLVRDTDDWLQKGRPI